jgi:hypothetical protein
MPEGNFCSMAALSRKEKGGIAMDASRCPHCNKPMKAVMTKDGRTGLQCLSCDKVDQLETDAVKWTDRRAGTKAA